MKRLKYGIVMLLSLFFSIASYSQTANTAFYYYNGQKIYLAIDDKTISVTLDGPASVARLQSAISNAQTKVSDANEDYTRATVIALDQPAKNRKAIKNYYCDITTTQSRTMAEYNKQLAGYKNIAGVVMASPGFITPEGKKMGLSNNFYIKLKNAGDVNSLYEQAVKLNIEVLGYNQFMPLWFTLSCGKITGMNALEAANKLYETGLFESTEPAFVYQDLLTSNDPYFNDQWTLKNTGQNGGGNGVDIKAEQAWTITKGSAGIKTAIFDEGFEMNHPDLQNNTFGTGYDALTAQSPSHVYGSHATSCAGIIAAVQNNNIGVSGVAPDSKIMSVSTDFGYTTAQILANGFNWAWQNGASVISNSWGGGTPSTIFDNAVTNALTNGRGGLGTVVVFSSGNNNSSSSNYPGNSNPLILNVGAIDRCGVRSGRIDIIPQSCDPWCVNCSPGSAYGSTLDVVAGGSSISTTDRQGANGYDPSDYAKSFGGTSAACPFVAGVVSLLLSANPNLTVQQVDDIIEQSAQKVRTDLYSYTTTVGRPNGTWNNQLGYGLVNAYQAVLSAQSYNCSPTLTITNSVFTGGIEKKQASVNIIASNLINNGASAYYHAGAEISLNPGFEAANGSIFHGYIEGCTGMYSRNGGVVQQPAVITYNLDEKYNKITSKALEINSTDEYSIFPNPATGYFTLVSKNDLKNATVQLMDILGRAQPIRVTDINNYSKKIQWSTLGKGVYMVIIRTDKNKEMKKIVIE